MEEKDLTLIRVKPLLMDNHVSWLREMDGIFWRKSLRKFISDSISMDDLAAADIAEGTGSQSLNDVSKAEATN